LGSNFRFLAKDCCWEVLILCHMAFHAAAICRNTFISFVIDDADDSALASPKLQPRSRSAELFRRRPDLDEVERSPQQSIQRLNAVLSVGISSPLQLPQKADQQVRDGIMFESSPVSRDCISELRTLQEGLARALAGKATPQSPQTKVWDKNFRNASNCSLSTMAPDDASDCGELPSRAGLSKMPRAWSSGSVSTLWSDIGDDFTEDGEVTFDLDIEAGAEAALEAHDGRTSRSEPVVSTLRGKATPEMSHGMVPKNQNMKELFTAGKAEPATTMMIRNIPGRYSQNDLMTDLKDLGFAGTYDFLYAPMDKGTTSSVGYAFVNFIHPSWAVKCKESFDNYRFSIGGRSSSKLGSVSVAHLQGLEKNLQHYEKTAVNMSKGKCQRPVVVANIAEVFG